MNKNKRNIMLTLAALVVLFGAAVPHVISSAFQHKGDCKYLV